MKAALIGLGMVAETHLAALQHSSKVDLCGVLARQPSTTSAFAKKATALLGEKIYAYDGVDDLIADRDVDFAIVATPPDQRLELVRSLVAHKIPILMEKPVERTLTAARQIVALCAEAQVPLGVVLQHRARALSRTLKSAVEAGQLGTIVAAELRIPWWRDQSYYDAPGRGTYARDGGGVMMTQAIHTLDLALWLLGPVKTVQALMKSTDVHQMEAEDWAGALFTTFDGVVGSVMATTAAYPGSSDSIAITGTIGTAHLQAGHLQISLHSGHTQSYGNSQQGGGEADPMAFTHEWHMSVLEDFAMSLSSGKPSVATGSSALHAHEMIDAMERSNRLGQRVEVTNR